MKKDERRSRFGAISLVLSLSIGTVACSDCGKQTAPAADAAPATPPPPAPTSSTTGKRPSTTSADIAIGNLSGQIKMRIEKMPPFPPERTRLISLLLERASCLGSIADLETADKLTREWLEAAEPPDAATSKDGELHLARGHAHAALHRFDDALKELQIASDAGIESARIARARAAIYIARGQYDEALTQRMPDFEKRDSGLIATAAVLAAKMKKPAESERLFELAREQFIDVSPFPVAGWDFQRGQLFEIAGDDKTAKMWFAEAVDILPQYAHAAVHLAPSEAPGDAVARLEAIRKTSDNPEVTAALAAVHQKAGHAADTKRLVAEAKQRYEVVVAKYPEAFSDHAARFLLGPGDDPKKALDLAKLNAKNRPTEEALDLWMAAGVGAKSNDDICAAAGQMLKLKYLSDRGKRTASGAAAKCPAPAP